MDEITQAGYQRLMYVRNRRCSHDCDSMAVFSRVTSDGDIDWACAEHAAEASAGHDCGEPGRPVQVAQCPGCWDVWDEAH